MNYLRFEEPCLWEQLGDTKKVADALKIEIAFGEQNSSLWQFQWMIDNHVMSVVQPDDSAASRARHGPGVRPDFIKKATIAKA